MSADRLATQRALVIAARRCMTGLSAGLLHFLAELRDPHTHVILMLPTGFAGQVPDGVEAGRVERSATQRAWYGAGLQRLNMRPRIAQIVLCDDSFVALNPQLLLARSAAAAAELDIAALTLIGAPEPALQSYWLSFAPRPGQDAAAFLGWWQQGGEHSEAAMTQHLRAAGYALGGLLQLDRRERLIAVSRAHACGALHLPTVRQDGFELDPELASALDPTAFAWDKLMAEFGVVSRQLVAENPHRVNIAKLRRWITQTPGAASLFELPQGPAPQ